MKTNTYGIQFNPTDRSYTVIINGVTSRNFQRNDLALAYIDRHKAVSAAKGAVSIGDQRQDLPRGAVMAKRGRLTGFDPEGQPIYAPVCATAGHAPKAKP